MFKVICLAENCANKNIIYYIPEPSNLTMCGGCKLNIIPIKMSNKEFNEVFDYDPYKEPTIGFLPL